MKTRTKALGLLLLLVATTCLVLRASRPSEPNYEGKPLSFWIEQYRLEVDSSEPGPATDAMRAIGTNALPFLRNWSSYNPPRWQHQFGGQFLPRHVFGIDIVLGSQARLERADQAILALSAFRATPTW